VSSKFLNDSGAEWEREQIRYAQWNDLGKEKRIKLLDEYHKSGYESGLEVCEWISRKTGIQLDDIPENRYR
jgi:hypothetical protein